LPQEGKDVGGSTDASGDDSNEESKALISDDADADVDVDAKRLKTSSTFDASNFTDDEKETFFISDDSSSRQRIEVDLTKRM